MLTTVKFLLEEGGFATYVLFATAVILVIVASERFYFLYIVYSFKVETLLAQIQKEVLKREYTRALQVCNSLESAPELSVVKSGLIAAEHGREAMRSSLGGAVLNVQKKCDHRVQILSLIAAVSTLMGLLGTISGLIKTFAAIANADASEKARLLGTGISEAMYSTAFGLVVGIIAMVAHTLAQTKGDDIVGKCQDAGYKLITWIEESERSRANG